MLKVKKIEISNAWLLWSEAWVMLKGQRINYFFILLAALLIGVFPTVLVSGVQGLMKMVGQTEGSLAWFVVESIGAVFSGVISAGVMFGVIQVLHRHIYGLEMSIDTLLNGFAKRLLIKVLPLILVTSSMSVLGQFIASEEAIAAGTWQSFVFLITTVLINYAIIYVYPILAIYDFNLKQAVMLSLKGVIRNLGFLIIGFIIVGLAIVFTLGLAILPFLYLVTATIYLSFHKIYIGAVLK